MNDSDINKCLENIGEIDFILNQLNNKMADFFKELEQINSDNLRRLENESEMIMAERDELQTRDIASLFDMFTHLFHQYKFAIHSINDSFNKDLGLTLSKNLENLLILQNHKSEGSSSSFV